MKKNIETQKKTNIDEELVEVVRFFEDKKAEDIVVLNLANTSNYFNYFVILTAHSSLHLKALVKDFYYTFHKSNIYPGKKQVKLNQEEIESGWFIIDLIDVVIHLFLKEEREYYQLEKLWKETEALKINKISSTY